MQEASEQLFLQRLDKRMIHKFDGLIKKIFFCCRCCCYCSSRVKTLLKSREFIHTSLKLKSFRWFRGRKLLNFNKNERLRLKVSRTLNLFNVKSEKKRRQGQRPLNSFAQYYMLR